MHVSSPKRGSATEVVVHVHVYKIIKIKSIELQLDFFYTLIQTTVLQYFPILLYLPIQDPYSSMQTLNQFNSDQFLIILIAVPLVGHLTSLVNKLYLFDYNYTKQEYLQGQCIVALSWFNPDIRLLSSQSLACFHVSTLCPCGFPCSLVTFQWCFTPTVHRLWIH